MSRNKNLLIIASAIALVFLLLAVLTEFREVPAYEWKEKFSYDDQQPEGLYIFKELVNRYFKDVPSTLNGYPEDTLNTNSLYIQFVPKYLESHQVDTLLNIASNGNDVLIIADLYADNLADSFPFYIEDTFLQDSVLNFNFIAPEYAADSNYSYVFHDKEFAPYTPKEFYLMEGLYWEEDLEFIRVATPDSLILFAEFKIGDGRVFYHVKKDLFYNYSYRQNQMFDYTQRILSYFDPQHVYLLSPIIELSDQNQTTGNPLEFIMSRPALKAAYYLLIIGVLLYVFFGGRRKQKVIPVHPENKNTSLEYIETVSQLFYQQGQHEKLVAHMKEIFHHKMQKKFFVAPDDPNYLDVLTKKSKISKTELQYVLDRFKNLEDNFNFRGDQLVSLNRRLEHIYKEIETK